MPVNIVERPHQLVRVKLYEKRMHLLTKFLEAFLNTIDICRNVVHHNIKLTGVAFIARIEESMLNSDYILVMHFFMNLKLATLVLLVLLQFLNCHYLACLGKWAHVDNRESSMTALDL